jgi:hypothetical protein
MSESFMLDALARLCEAINVKLINRMRYLENKCVFAVLPLGLNDDCRRGLRFGDPYLLSSSCSC